MSGRWTCYVRLFDDQRTQPDDNPTIGIVLCANRNEAVAKYSVLADKKGIFASQYSALSLPTEEELSQDLKKQPACSQAKKNNHAPGKTQHLRS